MTIHESELSEIVVDRPHGGVLRVRLNRPAALNAYTTRLAEETRDIFRAAARDDSVRAVVLTGAGRAFSSGGDVLEPDVPEKADSRQLGWWVVMSEGIHELAITMWNFDKPIIGAINGPAVSGGLSIALLCDLRIASEEARLGDSSGRFGYLPDDGGAWLFPRTMGYRQALRMSWLHEVYSAEKALELGLVDEVVSPAALERRSLELAQQLAAESPVAVRITKRMMRRALDLSFEQSLEDAQMAVALVNDSQDVAEGVAAFREKRPPEFRGQ
jgi:2-(1,2-epoxy-1,2-dihydrophenyl)acetyl-CoA isomerase